MMKKLLALIIGVCLSSSSLAASSEDGEQCIDMASEYLKENVFGKGSQPESKVKDRPDLIDPLLDKISNEYPQFDFSEIMKCLNSGAKKAKSY